MNKKVFSYQNNDKYFLPFLAFFSDFAVQNLPLQVFNVSILQKVCFWQAFLYPSEKIVALKAIAII